MALHSRADLCKLLDISQAYFKVNLNRGKIILDKNGMIDDSKDENHDFIQKQIAKKNGEKAELRSETKKTERIETQKAVFEDSEPKKTEGLSKYEMEQRQKQLQNEKLEEEIKKLRITIEKLEGEVIPTDLVKMIIVQQSKAAVTAFKNACDNILDEFAIKSKMSNEERSRLRGVITKETNAAIDEAIKLAKKETKNIADQFSEKRGKGERK